MGSQVEGSSSPWAPPSGVAHAFLAEGRDGADAAGAAGAAGAAAGTGSEWAAAGVAVGEEAEAGLEELILESASIIQKRQIHRNQHLKAKKTTGDMLQTYAD